MGLLLSTRRALVGGGTYADKVLSYDPIAYWPLDESAGTVARCLVNTAQNGTYARDVATMGTQAGIGDGNTAPTFDGAADYVNVNTATLAGAWNAGGAEWTIGIWAQVSAAVWADATNREILAAYDTATNYVYFRKANEANGLEFLPEGGDVAHTHVYNGVVSTDWMYLTMTRSEAADELRYYWNGGWLATDAVIGNWSSAGAWTSIILGAGSVVPTSAFQGGLAHCAMWPRALPLAGIAALALV